MKTLRQIKEKLEIPAIGQTLSRDLMPQIDSDFLKYLKNKGISYTKKQLNTSDLKSTQSEFDDLKILSLMSNNDTDPIFVSNDDYVLDGHHRWIADHNTSGKTEAYVIDLPILELLRVAKEYESMLKEEYKLWNDVHDASKGEISGTITAHNAKEWTGNPSENRIGKISYSYHKPTNTLKVKMIETHPEHKRKGIATAMVKYVKSEFPDSNINWGTTTGEGSKFIKSLKEEVTHKDFGPMMDAFVSFASDKLGIKSLPKINYKNEDEQGEQPSFGGYNPSSNEIIVCTKNRHPMDVFRTLAHELVHHKQNEDGRIKDVSKEGSTGSPIEDEANSLAGRLMRWFGKANPDKFTLSHIVESKYNNNNKKGTNMSDLDEDCWKGYHQPKKKMLKPKEGSPGQFVPNCVPNNKSVDEEFSTIDEASNVYIRPKRGVSKKEAMAQRGKLAPGYVQGMKRFAKKEFGKLTPYQQDTEMLKQSGAYKMALQNRKTSIAKKAKKYKTKQTPEKQVSMPSITKQEPTPAPTPTKNRKLMLRIRKKSAAKSVSGSSTETHSRIKSELQGALQTVEKMKEKNKQHYDKIQNAIEQQRTNKATVSAPPAQPEKPRISPVNQIRHSNVSLEDTLKNIDDDVRSHFSQHLTSTDNRKYDSKKGAKLIKRYKAAAAAVIRDKNSAVYGNPTAYNSRDRDALKDIELELNQRAKNYEKTHNDIVDSERSGIVHTILKKMRLRESVNSPSSREWGTNSLARTYALDTPGQKYPPSSMFPMNPLFEKKMKIVRKKEMKEGNAVSFNSTDEYNTLGTMSTSDGVGDTYGNRYSGVSGFGAGIQSSVGTGYSYPFGTLAESEQTKTLKQIREAFDKGIGLLGTVEKSGSNETVEENVDKDSMACNKPRAQAHGSGETGKSHIVKACAGGKEKVIRFGQLGVKGSPKKEGESEAYRNRRKRFKARHSKNIAKGKMSAAYWANKVKW